MKQKPFFGRKFLSAENIFPLFLFLATAVLVAAGEFVLPARAAADEVISQPDFSVTNTDGWGSYGAAIGIASGTVTEIGTTTAAFGDFSMAYLGWECDAVVHDAASPSWCAHDVPLSVATTSLLGSSTRAYVFKNPHQVVDGNVQIFYVSFYGGYPATIGFGTGANTVSGLSWAWTCGDNCRNGGVLGGTSHGFVPYFEMGDQANPPSLDMLTQATASGTVPLGGVVSGGEISFGAHIGSSVPDPLEFQVEVASSAAPFTGMATASSSVSAGEDRIVTIPDLGDGGYHWAARVVDTATGLSSPWVPFSAAGSGSDFVVQKPKEPVVFIPGIVGTRLATKSSGKEVWPDIGDMLLSPNDEYLDDLALAPDGSEAPGKELVPTSIIDKESVLGVTLPFYQNVFSVLSADGYSSGTSLFPAGYDWRLGMSSAVAAVSSTVAAARAASLDGKVSLIGYSMGGLVAKAYLAGLADPSFVHKLILVGAPQLGSPEAFRVLNYGDNLGFQVPLLHMDILSHGEVQKISQNMPAIYDLLPSRKYLEDNGSYVTDFRDGRSAPLDYDATDRIMLDGSLGVRNAPLLAAADRLHTGLDDAAPNAPETYNIVGCSEPTIAEYHLYDNGVVDISRTAGDGTVPLASALDRSDDAVNYFVSGSRTGITHANLTSDGRTLGVIAAILDDRDSAMLLPEGFSRRLDSCFADQGPASTEIAVNVHGVGAAALENAQGQRIGMNASGTLELDIPGSSLVVVGGNYFITAPAGTPYHLTTEGSAAADMTVAAAAYDGVRGSEGNTYVVPRSTSTDPAGMPATTTAILDISDSGTAGDLLVNKSAAASSSQDASTTIAVPPLTGMPATDILPPEISISGIPDTATAGSTTTVHFSADDPGSGIIRLAATFNGVPVSDGAVISFADTGKNIFRVEALDGAGNPSVREMAVSVQGLSRTLSFFPIADTYVDALHPDASYGMSSFLRLRSRGRNRAFLKFDGAAIRSGIGSGTIVAAELSFPIMKNWQNWSSSGTLGLYAASTSWTEDGLSWPGVGISANDMSPRPIALASVMNDTTGTLSFSFGDTPFPFLDILGGNGFVIRKTDECSPGVIDLDSRESGDPPKLTLVVQ